MTIAEPYGGELKDLYESGESREALHDLAGGLPSWNLSGRQLCDVELLLNGAFSPLEGFLGRDVPAARDHDVGRSAAHEADE